MAVGLGVDLTRDDLGMYPGTPGTERFVPGPEATPLPQDTTRGGAQRSLRDRCANTLRAAYHFGQTVPCSIIERILTFAAVVFSSLVKCGVGVGLSVSLFIAQRPVTYCLTQARIDRIRAWASGLDLELPLTSGPLAKVTDID